MTHGIHFLERNDSFSQPAESLRIPIRLNENPTTSKTSIYLYNPSNPHRMCIVKLRPEREEEAVVPNRPVRIVSPPTTHSGRNTHTSLSVAGSSLSVVRVRSHPRAPETSLRASGTVQAIVLQEISPRSSRSKVPQIRPLSQESYQYGAGPIPAGYALAAPEPAGVRQRSGSMNLAKSPRQSNASYRSTRERIVVVDESGRRREYYKRDDSGR